MTDAETTSHRGETSDPIGTPALAAPAGILEVDTNRFYSPGRLASFGIRSLLVAGLAVVVFCVWLIAFIFAAVTLGDFVGIKQMHPLVRSVGLTLLVFAPLIASVMFVLFLQTRRARKITARALQEHGSSDFRAAAEVLIAHLMRSASSRSHGMIGGLHAFVGVGGFGSVIRGSPQSDPPPIVPLGAPIEPVALDRTDAAFQELAAATDGSSPGTEVRPGRRPRLLARFLGTSSRTMRTGGRVVGIGVVTGFIVFEAVASLQTGGVTFGLMFWSFIGLTSLPSVRRVLRAPFRGSEWFLVAGGLVRRKLTWLGRYRIHLFDRTKSILCAVVSVDGSCQVGVADRAAHRVHKMEAAELNLLLHVWLSPVGPPTPGAIERVLGSGAG